MKMKNHPPKNWTLLHPFLKTPAFYFLLFIFYFLNCKNEHHPSVTPAFYHWQTHLQLSPTEHQLMESLNVKKLYVKFFDIDLNENGEPVPNAVVKIDTHLLNNIVIIPAVFITNRTFNNISKKEIGKLAENIFDKINGLHPHPFPETQFDCDWTQTTRDNYFYFLEYFKTLAAPPSTVNRQPSTVSATIRLHQLKYPEKTGIPPVDKGMLMFYNMGNLDNWETENSILDLDVAEQYHPSQPYPLPLDVALPIFKWGVIFRNNKLVYLINNLSEKEMRDTARFFKINKNRFRVKRSTYLGGHYLYEGDLVRLEGVGPAMLENAGAGLSKFSPKESLRKKLGKPEQKELTISFYHLDTTTLASFRYEDFEKILEEFNDK